MSSTSEHKSFHLSHPSNTQQKKPEIKLFIEIFFSHIFLYVFGSFAPPSSAQNTSRQTHLHSQYTPSLERRRFIIHTIFCIPFVPFWWDSQLSFSFFSFYWMVLCFTRLSSEFIRYTWQYRKFISATNMPINLPLCL